VLPQVLLGSGQYSPCESSQLFRVVSHGLSNQSDAMVKT
jgi:hypothetical protein